MPRVPLKPSLWRTCRILANRSRLRLLNFVWKHPGATVVEIAAGLGLSTALASKYLRQLNARGLLAATRRAARVHYRLAADDSVPQSATLVRALTKVFQERHQPFSLIYAKATALTHPRRVAIVARLGQRPAHWHELQRQLAISGPALHRHLRKLHRRGWLQSNQARGTYAIITRGASLDRALIKLAMAE